MGFTLRTEEFNQVKGEDGRSTLRLIKQNHYIRVKTGDTPPVFLQHGRIYSEGGQLIDPLSLAPDLVADIKRIQDKSLETVEFHPSKVKTSNWPQQPEPTGGAVKEPVRELATPKSTRKP